MRVTLTSMEIKANGHSMNSKRKTMEHIEDRYGIAKFH